MAESNLRRLWSSERPIQQLGSYQMVSEPSPSTAFLTTSMAPEGIVPLKVPLTAFSADLGTIIASIRHDFSRINSSLDRCINHLNGSRSPVVSESHHGSPGFIDSYIVYGSGIFPHDEVSVLFPEIHTQNLSGASHGLDTDEQLRVFAISVKETASHGVRSENMSSSGSIDIHEPAVDTQFDSWIKIPQEPQSKSTEKGGDAHNQPGVCPPVCIIQELQEMDGGPILGLDSLRCQGMRSSAAAVHFNGQTSNKEPCIKIDSKVENKVVDAIPTAEDNLMEGMKNAFASFRKGIPATEAHTQQHISSSILAYFSPIVQRHVGKSGVTFGVVIKPCIDASAISIAAGQTSSMSSRFPVSVAKVIPLRPSPKPPWLFHRQALHALQLCKY